METLKKILSIPSVSGYESELKKLIKDEISEYCTEVYEDNFGNLISKIGCGSEKILINTSVSEDGFFVTSSNKGKVKVSPIGNVKPVDIVGGRYTDGIHTGIAVIKEKKYDEADIFDLVVDFFENDIECGTVLAPCGEYMINNEYCTGKSAALKTCIWILINIIKKINKSDTTCTFVFSVQDNLGFKGAKVAFNNIDSDCSYVISSASDSNKLTEIELSKGPCVRLKDKFTVFGKHIIETLLNKINLKKFQKEIVDSEGLSNNRAQYLNNGIPLLNINIPVRYEHTFNETVCLRDAYEIIEAFTR